VGIESKKQLCQPNPPRNLQSGR